MTLVRLQNVTITAIHKQNARHAWTFCEDPHTHASQRFGKIKEEKTALSFSLVRFRKVMWRPGQPIATRLYSRNLCVCDPNVL